MVIKILMIILALIIQLIIPPLFSAGIKPDLLLVVVVVMGLVDGIKTGGVSGFIAGMLQDLFLGGMFGVYTIVKAFCGAITGLLEQVIFKEKIIITSLIIFVITYIHELLVILLSDQLLFRIEFVYVLKAVILPEAIINSIIGLIIYYLYYKINNPGGSYYG